MHRRSLSRFVPASTLTLALVVAGPACKRGSEGGSDAGAEAGDVDADGAVVAKVGELHGRGGLRSEGMPDGTFLGEGAPIRIGQTLETPRGLRVELQLDSGATLRVDEQSSLRLTAADVIEVERGRVVAIAESTDGADLPLELRSHSERLALARGRAQVDASDSTRAWSIPSGHATLELPDGRSFDLAAGTRMETPIAPPKPDVADGPPRGPIASTQVFRDGRWAEDFENAKILANGLPMGVGSLDARRPNSESRSQPLRIAEQRVDVTIRGRVAHTQIEQVFHNDSGQELEGTYRFPLPGDASISGLQLLVGNRWMEGAMVEKTRARQIFKSIVDRVVPRDPALLEWEQGNVFKLKIFPIPAHGSRRVRLSYTQELPESAGEDLRYRYPMGGSGATGTEIGRFDFNVTVDAENVAQMNADAVRTPMMELERQRLDGHLRLSHHADNFIPTHEFGVDLPAPNDSFVTHTDRDGQRYFMLAMRPEFSAEPAESVDYVFIVDRSHGTAPELWTAARGLVDATLASMDPRDRFSVLACDTTCDPMTGQLQSVDAGARQRAADFLGSQQLGGASDIGEMLRAGAAQLGPHSGGQRVLVYLGDGVPSSGALSANELVDLTRSEELHGVQLHALAMGARADTLLLGALAEATGGVLEVAGLSDDLDAIARGLQARAHIPAIDDLSLDLPPGAYDVHPRALPPLRNGDEIRVYGKLPSAPTYGTTGVPQELRARLQRRGSGESMELAHHGERFHDRAHPYLPRLWAAAEINWLTTHEGYAAHDRIVALSERFTVLSRFTALLALENDAMYRQYAVRRRDAETDRWQGELSRPVSALGTGGLGQTPALAVDDSATNRGLRTSSDAVRAAGSASAPAPKGGEAWFEGEAKNEAREQARPEAEPTEESEPSLGAEIATSEAQANMPMAGGAKEDSKALEKDANFAANDAFDDPSAPLDDLDAVDESFEAGGDFDAPAPDAETRSPDLSDPFDGAKSKSASKKTRPTTPRPSRPASTPSAQPKPGSGRGPMGTTADFGDDAAFGGMPSTDPPVLARPRPRPPRYQISPASAPTSGSESHLMDLLAQRDADPSDRARHRKLVWAALRAGDPRALGWAAEWAESDPDHSRALIAQADALAMQGHPMVFRAYESAAEATPFSATIHRWLAEGLENEGRWARACSHRRALASIDPRRESHWVDLYDCWSWAGDAGRAREALAQGRARAQTHATLDARERKGPAARRGMASNAAIRTELDWAGSGEFDLVLVDGRGRRLSLLHPEAQVSGLHRSGHEELALRRYTQPLYVEVTRRDGARDSTHLRLDIKTPDARRHFEFDMSGGTRRIALIRRR